MISSNTEIELARQLFASEGLPFPFIPLEVQSNFRKIAEWIYGTRNNTPSLYKLDWFVNEVITESVPNYVLIGHAGHGINSYAIHFYLVLDNLALFIQIGWGGVYMDNELAAQRIETAFEQAAQLIHTMEKRHLDESLPQNQRLIVVESDLQESRWSWIEQRENQQNEIETLWIWGEEVLPAVLEAIID